MEDLRYSNSLFNQIKVADFVTLFFSLGSVGLAVVANEKDYELLKNSSTEDSEVRAIEIFAVVLNLLSICSIVLRYKLYFKWLHAKKHITKYDTIKNTGIWKTLLLEVSINLIMPYPFFSHYVYSEKFIFDSETIV